LSPLQFQKSLRLPAAVEIPDGLCEAKAVAGLFFTFTLVVSCVQR